MVGDQVDLCLFVRYCLPNIFIDLVGRDHRIFFPLRFGSRWYQGSSFLSMLPRLLHGNRLKPDRSLEGQAGYCFVSCRACMRCAYDNPGENLSLLAFPFPVWLWEVFPFPLPSKVLSSFTWLSLYCCFLACQDHGGKLVNLVQSMTIHGRLRYFL